MAYRGGATSRSLLPRQNLDSADHRVVNDICKVDVDRAVGHCDRERPFDGSVDPAARLSQDVEVREHLLAVDRHVEGALASRGPVQLGELQHYTVLTILGVD